MAEDGKKGVRRRAVRKGAEDYEVLCDVCGKPTLEFKKGIFLDKVGFVYTGITHETTLPMEQMPRIFRMLEKEALRDLHEFLIMEIKKYEGMDAYCPDCGMIYCKDHWVMEVKYDEDFPGFYDCTYGTCPRGHRRMIDD